MRDEASRALVAEPAVESALVVLAAAVFDDDPCFGHGVWVLSCVP